MNHESSVNEMGETLDHKSNQRRVMNWPTKERAGKHEKMNAEKGAAAGDVRSTLLDQKGLSEIAMAPTLFASWSTLITAVWWVPHLWRQSTEWGVLFALSAVVCLVLLPFLAGISYAETHGIPSILTFLIGFGIIGVQVYQVIELYRVTKPFPLQAALRLNHGPVYLGAAIIFVRGIVYKMFGRRGSWLDMF